MTIVSQSDENPEVAITLTLRWLPLLLRIFSGRRGAAPPNRLVPVPRAEGDGVILRHENTVLSICNFFSKGWEVSILGLLAFLLQKYGLSLYLVGILSTVFIVSQVGVSFFAGKIAHAVHSRNVIFLAIASSGSAWLTLFFAHGIPALYVAYGLAGIASGLFEPIGNSLIAKRSAAKNRGAAIGNFAAFGDMGRIAVVAAATALAGWFGVNNACGLLFLSTIVALVLAASFIAKTAEEQDLIGQPMHVPLHGLLKNGRFRLATLAGITDTFSSASLYIFIPFRLAGKGIPLDNTLYYNVIFFAGYMAGRLILGRVADRFGAPRTLIVSEILMGALILLLTIASGKATIASVLFVLGLFARGTFPSSEPWSRTPSTRKPAFMTLSACTRLRPEAQAPYAGRFTDISRRIPA